jgi:hypothetical protein
MLIRKAPSLVIALEAGAFALVPAAFFFVMILLLTVQPQGRQIPFARATATRTLPHRAQPGSTSLSSGEAQLLCGDPCFASVHPNICAAAFAARARGAQRHGGFHSPIPALAARRSVIIQRWVLAAPDLLLLHRQDAYPSAIALGVAGPRLAWRAYPSAFAYVRGFFIAAYKSIRIAS